MCCQDKEVNMECYVTQKYVIPSLFRSRDGILKAAESRWTFGVEDLICTDLDGLLSLDMMRFFNGIMCIARTTEMEIKRAGELDLTSVRFKDDFSLSHNECASSYLCHT